MRLEKRKKKIEEKKKKKKGKNTDKIRDNGTYRLPLAGLPSELFDKADRSGASIVPPIRNSGHPNPSPSWSARFNLASIQNPVLISRLIDSSLSSSGAPH